MERTMGDGDYESPMELQPGSPRDAWWQHSLLTDCEQVSLTVGST